MNENQGDIRTAIDEARKPHVLFQDATPYAFIPNDGGGFTFKILEEVLPAPTRKRATVTITDVVSLLHYLDKHAVTGQTTVYVNADSIAGAATIIAVINDHAGGYGNEHGGIAGWRDHTATYTPIKSVEWNRWIANSKKEMDQLAFATFIEDNIIDISNPTAGASDQSLPTGGQMLKMATDFEANYDKRFKQKLNLGGGGVQLEYIEDEDKDTRTKMVIFERFKIGIRVFRGGDAFAIYARLRYRQQDGKVMFRYELIRPDLVFDAALGAAIEKIVAAGHLVIFGAPK